MASNNDSDDDSSAFEQALEAVMFESTEALRLSKAARAADVDRDAIAKAARTIESGFESRSERRRRKSIEEALGIDPGCADALTLIAHTYEEPADAAMLLEAAVEVAERRLGPAVFNESSGKFWDLAETRPFMRALLAQAEAEIDSMDLQAGIECLERLLDLSALDNLGARHVLLGVLLAADRIEDSRTVAFERFAAEKTPFMLWARTLILYTERKFDAAGEMLARAKNENPYVEDLLMGEADLPEEQPATVAGGSPDEAALVASNLAAAWRSRPLALIWMKVGGKPGDDRYFGAYTNVELEGLLDELDEGEIGDDFDDEFDDFGGQGPILVN